MSQRPRRLSLESLEDRTVPAAAVDAAILPDLTQATAAAQQAAADNSAPKEDLQTKYVRKLYGDLLGRDLDAGAQGYISSLREKAMSRRDIAVSVLHSDEYAARQIGGMYHAFLGRAADQAALNGYLDEFKKGETIQAIGADILASEEYQTLHAGDAFLTGVYQDLLGRDLDAGAKADYGDRYAANHGEAHAIVDEIMNSAEMRQRTGEAVAWLMLDQLPSREGQNKYVKQAVNGTPMETIIADIAGSESYSDIGRSASTFNPGQDDILY